jgi:DNA-binding LacI/PurR family transcriptional regulator
MRDRQRSTVIDIARAAGVSVSTVSRVINGKPDVSQRTKQLVVDTMLAHGFMVNPVARSLIGARMRVIGVRGSMAGHGAWVQTYHGVRGRLPTSTAAPRL